MNPDQLSTIDYFSIASSIGNGANQLLESIDKLTHENTIVKTSLNCLQQEYDLKLKESNDFRKLSLEQVDNMAADNAQLIENAKTLRKENDTLHEENAKLKQTLLVCQTLEDLMKIRNKPVPPLPPSSPPMNDPPDEDEEEEEVDKTPIKKKRGAKQDIGVFDINLTKGHFTLGRVRLTYDQLSTLGDIDTVLGRISNLYNNMYLTITGKDKDINKIEDMDIALLNLIDGVKYAYDQKAFLTKCYRNFRWYFLRNFDTYSPKKRIPSTIKDKTGGLFIFGNNPYFDQTVAVKNPMDISLFDLYYYHGDGILSLDPPSIQ